MKKNPVVELVKAWEVFEQQHPDGTLEMFCRYQLQQQEIAHYQEEVNQIKDGLGYMRPADALTVAISRLSKYHSFYARKTLQTLPVDNSEDFAYLATLHFDGAMRKSELINRNISEFTTGTNVINRLLKHELIIESPDPHDARSRQVSITPKGVQWIQDCLPAMLSLSDLLLEGVVSEEEMRVAFLILSKIDHYHSQQVAEFRNRRIDEIRSALKDRR